MVKRLLNLVRRFLSGAAALLVFRKDLQEACSRIEAEIYSRMEKESSRFGERVPTLKVNQTFGRRFGEAEILTVVYKKRWSFTEWEIPTEVEIWATTTATRLHELGHVGLMLDNIEKSSIVKTIRPKRWEEEDVNDWVAERLPWFLRQAYLDVSSLGEATYPGKGRRG